MADIEKLVAMVRQCHRDRCHHMWQRIRAESSTLWRIKSDLGWSKNLPDAERKKIAKQAKTIMESEEVDERFEQFVMPTREFAAMCRQRQDVPEGIMESYASEFPAWRSFAEGVKGFGRIWFTTLIAEAGDLSNYRDDAALNKRMGVAPGQGRVPNNLSRDQRKQAWIERKFNPKRRSWMWNVEISIIKAQVRKVRDENGKDTGDRVGIGPYGEIFLREKRKQVAKAEAVGLKVVPANKIPKGRAAEYVSLGKINNYARKYMGKKLLRHLLRAWKASGEHQNEVARKGQETRVFPASGYELPSVI